MPSSDSVPAFNVAFSIVGMGCSCHFAVNLMGSSVSRTFAAKLASAFTAPFVLTERAKSSRAPDAFKFTVSGALSSTVFALAAMLSGKFPLRVALAFAFTSPCSCATTISSMAISLSLNCASSSEINAICCVLPACVKCKSSTNKVPSDTGIGAVIVGNSGTS